MIEHVFSIYRNNGLKPAIKAVLQDMSAGYLRRKHRAYYEKYSVSMDGEAEQKDAQYKDEQYKDVHQRDKQSKDNPHKDRAAGIIGDYCIVHTERVKLHRAYRQELLQAVSESKPALVYTDELKDGYLLFKPDYAPDNLAAHNYMGNCVAVRRDMMDKYAWQLAKKDSLWELNRYICAKCLDGEIMHICRALYEDLRTEDRADYGEMLKENRTRCADVHRENRTGAVGTCTEELTGNAETADTAMSMGMMGNGTQTAPDTNSQSLLISVIIPNCDHAEDLRRCIESLLYVNSYKNIEILIVENNSKFEETFAYYNELEKSLPDIIRILHWDGEFNYSAINNYGAAQAKGELLLLLNNDTKIIEPDSLKSMAAYAMRDNTGAVGACLLYGDKTLQHAGVIVGIGPDRTAVHPSQGVPFVERGYRDSIHHVQNYSAVTAACLMVRKLVYDSVGGLDEKLAVAYNDIDFCLRLKMQGLLNVYVPQALLFHYESKSRGRDDKGENHERFVKEVDFFKERWKKLLEAGDPYYNPNLSKEVPWRL